MSTEYSIFIKDASLSGSPDVLYVLKTAGATNPVLSEKSPDRYSFDYPGLEDCEVMNERIELEPAWEDEPEFGYDFQVVAWVRFAVDNQDTRDAVIRLAEHLARHFPILLMYQEVVLAKNEEPGRLELTDDLPDFIADLIRRDGLPEGMTPEQIGLE